MRSIAQRYSKVYRELGVLMGDLYSARPIFEQRSRAHRLPNRARTAVLLWRAYLVRTELRLRDGHFTGRSIDSFRLRQYLAVVEFDGCPRGVGFRLFSKTSEGERLVEEWGSGAPFDLGNDPQFQNTMEAAAAIVGITRALQLWGPGIAVHLRGDSETALTWLSKDMANFQSYRARGAAMLLVSLRESYGLYVDRSPTWIRGEENVRADALSRGYPLHLMDGVPLTTAGPGSTVWEALSLCDPLQRMDTALSVCEHWESVRIWAGRKLGPPSGPDYACTTLRETQPIP
jgi:hypothetical protein